MFAGELRHRVELAESTPDGSSITYAPGRIWVSIAPAPPGAFDERRVTHIVKARYHRQITFNTRLIHRERSLYVRGIQNVDEINHEMVLLCEEVVGS